MAELLRCDGITKKYGPLIALNNIDLSIEGGRIKSDCSDRTARERRLS